MYLHVCGLNISDIQTHMHRIQSIGNRDTGRYKHIQQCIYPICSVYIGYALDYIVCICVCISVCIFFRYIQDISVHIRVVSVCIFGRYALAGSLMTSSSLSIANVLRTGVQLNGDGLDPAHGLVAEAAARVVSRGRLVVVEETRLAAAGGAAHAGKALKDGSR